MEEMLKHMTCNGHWRNDIDQAFLRIFQTNTPRIDSKILKVFWFKKFAFKVCQNLTLFYAFCEVNSTCVS